MLTMNHGDDLSFYSIMSDIYMMKEINDKIRMIKVVVSVIGNEKAVESDMKLKCLRQTYDKKKNYEYCNKKFIFADDFYDGENYNSYQHYEYKYDDGSFRVDYKVLK